MAIFQSLGGNPQPSQQQTPKAPSTTRKILRYSMMPEILPRIRGLGMHFGHFAYLLALVFASARLIPHSHPVMNAANIGRFGVRQVIAIAANNLTWDRKHIDQIGIFSAIIIGLIMIVIQAGLIAVAALMGGEANAAADPGSFFESPNPAEDPIMIMFSNIFGDLGGFWGTGVAAKAPLSDNIIHTAVYNMLALYSQAMMVIAVIIVLYYILTVIGEAAKTGTPFGQRFNSLWAPIRLVIALGLLVPMGSGLNSAQYITLWMAKMGSGLGTQVWSEAWTAVNGSATTEKYVLGEFQSSWVRELAAHVFFMEVCAQGQNKYNDTAATGDYIVQAIADDTSTAEVGTPGSRRYKQATYGYEVKYQNEARVLGIFGGTYCGNITLKMSEEDVDTSLLSASTAVPVADIFAASKTAIERLVNSPVIKELAATYASETIPVGSIAATTSRMEDVFDSLMSEADATETALKNSFDNIVETDFAQTIDNFLSKSQNSWAYAGVFYIEISRIIQNSIDATTNAIPNTAIITMTDSNVVDLSVGSGPNGGMDGRVFAIQGVSNETNTAVSNAYKFYKKNADVYIPPNDPEIPAACVGINSDSDEVGQVACYIFALLVPDNLVLLARTGGANVDPMAALIHAGYEIIQRSWYSLIIGLTLSATGGVASVFGKVGAIVGGLLKTLGSIMILIASFGLAAGVIMYFMLPLFPFIYFFFALTSWVMEIFEAIIAMPLWALAHLRIDGDGMPGQAAINGYYLLLAILIRPALIVIGLIAGATIFRGMVFLLQSLWDGVLTVKGAGSVTGLEVLIYTIIYAYLCYSIALTCFKLVDTIPNQILRWIGSGANTFSDGKEDPIGNSNQLLTAGAAFFAGQGAGHLSSGASGMGEAAGQGLRDKYSKDGKSAQERDQAKQSFIASRRHDDAQEAAGRERTEGTMRGESFSQFTERQNNAGEERVIRPNDERNGGDK